ncbi:MAG: class A beta-lactamase [Pseudomonadota bacterium]
MISRRQFSKALSAVTIGGYLAGRVATARAENAPNAGLIAEFKRLEKASGGRLGVAMVDTGSAKRIDYRGDERFPMCSTFKALLAGAVLHRVDAGKEQLTRRVRVSKSDIIAHSPVTETRIGGDISLAELCEATVTLSDNAAANLLLVDIGGPEGFTRFVRSLGDPVTRLDRTEPALNEARPGDPRDTTTPKAMISNLQKLVLGTALSSASREQLARWLIDNKTGDTRIRAGLPSGWRVGDKTGLGERGTSNDIAVAWPPDRAPIILAVYLTGATVSAAQQNATIAAVAKAIATF